MIRSTAMRVLTTPSQPVILTPAGSVICRPGKRGSLIAWSCVAFAIGVN